MYIYIYIYIYIYGNQVVGVGIQHVSFIFKEFIKMKKNHETSPSFISNYRRN